MDVFKIIARFKSYTLYQIIFLLYEMPNREKKTLAQGPGKDTETQNKYDLRGVGTEVRRGAVTP